MTIGWPYIGPPLVPWNDERQEPKDAEREIHERSDRARLQDVAPFRPASFQDRDPASEPGNMGGLLHQEQADHLRRASSQESKP